MKGRLLFAAALLVCGVSYAEVVIEKELTYNQHTLEDTYPYLKTTREFQWEQIKEKLAFTDQLQQEKEGTWGILQNKANANGQPPITAEHNMDEYHEYTDVYDVGREQAIPLYLSSNLTTPDRYARDGSIINITGQQDKFLIATVVGLDGRTYYIPTKYVKQIAKPAFAKAVVVDRANQNISTYEKVGDVWKIRSMNPCTTGAHNPMLQKPTPLGVYIIQMRLEKMPFYEDGTTRIAGYAPYASRFCQGAYLHGVPVNLPHTEIVEFSPTLGTIPRSHMCVRNAASHAKFIYDNFEPEQALVYVIE
jgi:hypothetical protein